MADLSEKLSALETAQFDVDQRVAEGPSPPVYLSPVVDFNYAEHGAYETRWAEETALIQRLREMLREGEIVLNTIYTYRSCSMCMPQVKTQEQENRNAIYENTCAVLESEVRKLKDFLYYQMRCIKFFGEVVRCVGKKDEVSETLKLYLVRLLDLLSLLDTLKNMKASLNNDFSAYKRAAGFLRKGQTAAQDDQTQENHTLYLFLAYPNAITSNLREELKDCEEADRVLLQCATMCATALEQERYVLPSEKHCLLRVLPYALYLLDIPDDPKRNVFKNKALNMQQLARFFRRYPVVTVYGDMQLPMDVAIKRTPHYDDKHWQSLVPADPRIAAEYELVNHVAAIRQRHDEYLARFSSVINEVRYFRAERAASVTASGKPASEAFGPIPVKMAREVYAVVQQGILLLSDWSARIMQQAAWKYNHPNMSPDIRTEVDYERAIKYNYRPEERSALVETIAMVKGLARLFVKHDAFLSPVIRSAIHNELQEFVQHTLAEIIAEAGKKKKTAIRNDLTQLRSMSADWAGGCEPFSDAALMGSSSKKDKGHSSSAASAAQSIPQRQVGPSVIQLDLMRAIVYGLLQQRKEMSSSHVKHLEDFYARSLYYPYMLDLTGTVQKSTDLGELWYREFYLELSKRLQFAIDMSLPSILVEHVIESSTQPELLEYALYPLDIYNDAADRALRVLGQRHLYDEIEAEVNLCFDQLLFKLSEQVYSHFKTAASGILLDKPYRAQLEAVADAASKERYCAPRSRFDILLSQRHVQVLGRSVDLNRLVAQRINRMLRQNVDYLVSRFESSDLTAIAELDSQLLNVQLTHSLLAQRLDLDPWELIVLQGEEGCSIASYHDRVLLHVLFEIATDFAPNFNYNALTGRFLRCPYIFEATQAERDPQPKPNHAFLYGTRALHNAFSISLEPLRRVFGLPHVQSIIRLLGRARLPMLVSECLRNLDLKVKSVVVPYVTELTSGLPASSKLPLHQYGTVGSHGMFAAKLAELISYGDLKTEVLRHFKEIGNIVVLLRMFDQVLKQADLLSFIASAPALGITSETLVNPPPAEDPSQSSPLYAVVAGAAEVLKTAPTSRCTPSAAVLLGQNAWHADKMYRQPSDNVSLFSSVLRQINSIIDDVRAEWGGSTHPPENGVMDVEGPHEFYRLWSALEYVLCMPQPQGERQHAEMYGDGVNWAGCTFIHLLGQRHRFDALSFTYHTLNIEEAAPQRCTDVEVLKFLRNASLDRQLNRLIFASLETYFPAPTANAGLVISPPETLQLKYFVEMSGAGGSASPAPVVSAPSAGAVPTTPPMTMSTPPPPPPPPDEDEEDEDEEEPAPPSAAPPPPPPSIAPPPPGAAPPPMPPRPGR